MVAPTRVASILAACVLAGAMRSAQARMATEVRASPGARVRGRSALQRVRRALARLLRLGTVPHDPHLTCASCRLSCDRYLGSMGTTAARDASEGSEAFLHRPRVRPQASATCASRCTSSCYLASWASWPRWAVLVVAAGGRLRRRLEAPQRPARGGSVARGPRPGRLVREAARGGGAVPGCVRQQLYCVYLVK